MVVPTVSVAAAGSVVEGADAVFTLAASPPPASPVTVHVAVTAQGGFGAAAGVRTVTVPISGSVTVSVPTAGDSVDEPDGSVTVTVSGGSGYEVSRTQGAATAIEVDDDDGVGRNSRITRTLGPGDYTIEATTFPSAKTGPVTVTGLPT